MATFWKGMRVRTPLGEGTVVYQRMAPPTFVEAAAVSVLLDSKADRVGYAGTIFKAEEVEKSNEPTRD